MWNSLLTQSVALILIVSLTGCGSGQTEQDKTVTDSSAAPAKDSGTAENIAVPNNRSLDSYHILIFGNSHVQGLAALLTTIINRALPHKQVTVETAPGNDYLAERLNDERSEDMLLNNNWSHLILQAQKYSQSGAYDYPTTAAQAWIRMAKSQQTTPILFPEHPQQGKITEARRVHDIHLAIAEEEASCVSPVGLAWDRAIEINPNLQYHLSDGNHASAIGKLLTAFVHYQVITGEPADLVPYIAELDIDADVQVFLGQVATDTLRENQACPF